MVQPVELVQGYNDIVLLSETVGLQVIVAKPAFHCGSLFIVMIVAVYNLVTLL